MPDFPHNNTFSYSLRVWLTCVVSAPILFILIEICRGKLNWEIPGVTVGSAFNMWVFYAAFELFFSNNILEPCQLRLNLQGKIWTIRKTKEKTGMKNRTLKIFVKNNILYANLMQIKYS